MKKVKIIYEWTAVPSYMSIREYVPVDRKDYDRVIRIFNTQPEVYKLIKIKSLNK